MSMVFGHPPRRRRPSLTPMIDVVFLLLVFFLLVARFGAEGAIDVAGRAGSPAYEGPPRLVEVMPGGLSLNGRALEASELPDALRPLAASPEDAVVLRPRNGATLQDLVDALSLLHAAGYLRLVVVE
jgi:biopolymer transport protein ExbD